LQDRSNEAQRSATLQGVTAGAGKMTPCAVAVAFSAFTSRFFSRALPRRLMLCAVAGAVVFLLPLLWLTAERGARDARWLPLPALWRADGTRRSRRALVAVALARALCWRACFFAREHTNQAFFALGVGLAKGGVAVAVAVAVVFCCLSSAWRQSAARAMRAGCRCLAPWRADDYAPHQARMITLLQWGSGRKT
jgi:hypothetical protein